MKPPGVAKSSGLHFDVRWYLQHIFEIRRLRSSRAAAGCPTTGCLRRACAAACDSCPATAPNSAATACGAATWRCGWPSPNRWPSTGDRGRRRPHPADQGCSQALDLIARGLLKRAMRSCRRSRLPEPDVHAAVSWCAGAGRAADTGRLRSRPARSAAGRERLAQAHVQVSQRLSGLGFELFKRAQSRHLPVGTPPRPDRQRRAFAASGGRRRHARSRQAVPCRAAADRLSALQRRIQRRIPAVRVPRPTHPGAGCAACRGAAHPFARAPQELPIGRPTLERASAQSTTSNPLRLRDAGCAAGRDPGARRPGDDHERRPGGGHPAWCRGRANAAWVNRSAPRRSPSPGLPDEVRPSAPLP